MKTFLAQYGVGLFILILISILIAFASPIGRMIKTATNKQVKNVDNLTTFEIEKASAKTSNDAYALLYDDGELAISSKEIIPTKSVKENYGGFNTNAHPHPWNGTIENLNTSVKTVNFLDVVKFKNCDGLFYGCSNLESISHIENLDTSECVDMNSMFYYCKNLKELDVSHFDTSKISQMGCMFTKCEKLTNLDVSKWDTRNVKGMQHMFNSCQSLTSLDLSNFHTENVKSFVGMFNNCYKITSFDLTSFDTRSCTSMGAMFYNCSSLITILVSNGWSTTNIDTTDMFTHCNIDYVTYIGGDAS